MGQYYKMPEEELITNKEVEKLRADSKASYRAGFENAIRNPNKDPVLRKNYHLGDLMKSSLKIGPKIV